MNTQDYIDIYKKVVSETGNTELGLIIVQECGHDNRTPKSNFIEPFTKKITQDNRPNVELASPKQIATMKKYNIKYDNNTTRSEAADKIKASINEV